MAVASIRKNSSPIKSGSAPGVTAAPGIVTAHVGSLIVPAGTLQ
jgi:hypothetical protein